MQADSTVQGKGEVKAVWPYFNVFLPKGETDARIFDTITDQNENYGKTNSLAGKKIMVKFSSPITNTSDICVMMPSAKASPVFSSSAERIYTKPTSSTTAAYTSANRCLHISFWATVSIR